MDEIEFASDPYALASQEDRCAPRTRISIPSNLRPSGSRSFQTLVNDLSLSGFSAASVNRMHVGSICWLTLPGIEALQSRVIWWDGGMVGCAFEQLLSPIVHDNIFARWRGDSIYFRRG